MEKVEFNSQQVGVFMTEKSTIIMMNTLRQTLEATSSDSVCTLFREKKKHKEDSSLNVKQCDT